MKKAVVAANLAFILILASVIALQAIADRRMVFESAYEDAENLSDALYEHTRQTLAALDLGLSTLAERLKQLSAPNDGLMHDLLRIRQNSSVTTFAFYVLDAQGRLIATSRTAQPQSADFSESVEFTVHRDGQQEGLFLGPPRRGRVGHAEGRWIANVSRRIENSDGSFAGVAVAALSIEHLLAFYDALRIGAHGAVGLFGSSGALIARSPFVESLVGQNFAQAELFAEISRNADQDRFSGLFSTDSVSRISAFRRVGEGRALVYVGLAVDDILEPWRSRLAFKLAIGVLAFSLFSGASVLFWLFLARRREWEERRSARLRLLAEASAEAVKSPNLDALLRHVTDVARNLIGAHQAVTSLSRNGGDAQTIHAVSLSEKYQVWREYQEAPDGSGIYRLVTEANRPMRMTQRELEAHPAWRNFGAARERHPPLRGWLAVPIVSRDGANLGLLQLSDKEDGEFTDSDLSEVAQLASIAGVAIDNLTAMRAREEALEEAKAAREEIETIFSSISDAVYALDRNWTFLYLNSEAERLLGRKRDSVIGRNVWEEFPQLKESALHDELLLASTGDAPVSFEFHFEPTRAWYAVRAFPHRSGLTVYFQDVTEKREIEQRLRQAQKMDAIGQLTGGIAHDFNNLLTVILGNADLLADFLKDAPDRVRAQNEVIRKAGERAAELTHRLLAFARRQPLNPRATDLNELVGEVEGMLRRTLGENISIELMRDARLWTAVADPSELQNAILNLALNARDAMPDGGKLTIETANRTIDADYADAHAIRPGQYVLIAVSDTGIGMSPETAAMAFEPFFTTKAEGKGSGLGLSMVYGFARQSGGHVKIYSELGQGTTLKLYLPRAMAGEATAEILAGGGEMQRGSERVLVVEDDELVRQHTVHSLKSLGYEVEASTSGPEAIALLDAGARFDLLLTDVVLPAGMSGKQVAVEAIKRAPSLKVLFMSGYTENAIVHHGRLDPGVHLLSKPYRLTDLARKMREVLDA